MPSAKQVTPTKWSEIQVLYDNGRYSVIFGKFEGNKCLGERWNGTDSEYGYPSQGNNPLWHVVYSKFCLPILHKILDLHLQENSQTNRDKINSTIEAIRYFQSRR